MTLRHKKHRSHHEHRTHHTKHRAQEKKSGERRGERGERGDGGGEGDSTSQHKLKEKHIKSRRFHIFNYRFILNIFLNVDFVVEQSSVTFGDVGGCQVAIKVPISHSIVNLHEQSPAVPLMWCLLSVLRRYRSSCYIFVTPRFLLGWAFDLLRDFCFTDPLAVEKHFLPMLLQELVVPSPSPSPPPLPSLIYSLLLTPVGDRPSFDSTVSHRDSEWCVWRVREHSQRALHSCQGALMTYHMTII